MKSFLNTINEESFNTSNVTPLGKNSDKKERRTISPSVLNNILKIDESVNENNSDNSNLDEIDKLLEKMDNEKEVKIKTKNNDNRSTADPSALKNLLNEINENPNNNNKHRETIDPNDMNDFLNNISDENESASINPAIESPDVVSEKENRRNTIDKDELSNLLNILNEVNGKEDNNEDSTNTNSTASLENAKLIKDMKSDDSDTHNFVIEDKLTEIPKKSPKRRRKSTPRKRQLTPKQSVQERIKEIEEDNTVDTADVQTLFKCLSNNDQDDNTTSTNEIIEKPTPRRRGRPRKSTPRKSVETVNNINKDDENEDNTINTGDLNKMMECLSNESDKKQNIPKKSPGRPRKSSSVKKSPGRPRRSTPYKTGRSTATPTLINNILNEINSFEEDTTNKINDIKEIKKDDNRRNTVDPNEMIDLLKNLDNAEDGNVSIKTPDSVVNNKLFTPEKENNSDNKRETVSPNVVKSLKYDDDDSTQITTTNEIKFCNPTANIFSPGRALKSYREMPVYLYLFYRHLQKVV